jgi:hypothetical protein
MLHAIIIYKNFNIIAALGTPVAHLMPQRDHYIFSEVIELWLKKGKLKAWPSLKNINFATLCRFMITIINEPL